MTRISMELDYRNFKHTSQDHNPREYPLALAIWQAAYKHVPRDKERAPNKHDWFPGAVTLDVAGGEVLDEMAAIYGISREDDEEDIGCNECGRTADQTEMSDEPDLCVDCYELDRRLARAERKQSELDAKGDHLRDQQKDRDLFDIGEIE
jgi:hypothetical protein